MNKKRGPQWAPIHGTSGPFLEHQFKRELDLARWEGGVEDAEAAAVEVRGGDRREVSLIQQIESFGAELKEYVFE